MLYNKGIKKLDFKNYKRFFAFGCSFTNYKWPTWADIISQEVKEYYNFGVSGAGNFYIFHTVMQADALYNFTPDDLILIKWTNVHREDRYIEDSKHPLRNDIWINRWLTPGNIYSQDIYTKDFMEYYSDTHCIMRDLSLLTCLRGYLQNKNLTFDFLSMVPLASALDGAKLALTQTAKNAIAAYKPIVDSMPPSIYELIFNNNWHSISPRASYWVPWSSDYVDNHAHPAEHLAYIQTLYPETEFKNETVEYAKKWHQFVLDKHDAYLRPCIDRPLVKGFHSWREDLTYENNTM